MKRKIIKLGQATFVTSLPSKWVRRYNLKPGDYLDVEEQENTLLVSTEKLQGSRSISIQLPEKKLFLKRLVYVPYRFGYDEVKFTYQDPELIHNLEDAGSILMGFEIVDQGERFCVFRNISKGLEEEFDGIFRRVFFIIQNALSDAADIVDSGELSRFKGLKETEKVINKLVCFSERVINKRGAANFMANSFAYITMWTLEQVGDEIKQLATVLATMQKVSPKTKRCIADTQTLFDQFSRLYFKPTLQDAVTFKDMHTKFREQVFDSLNSVSGKDARALYHILGILDKTNAIALSIQLTAETQKSHAV